MFQDADSASIITDFSTGIPAYVSRTEILKFYDKTPTAAATTTAPPPLPPPSKGQNRQKSSKSEKNRSSDLHPEFIPPPPPVIQRRLPASSKKSQNIVRIHDSWSSRASSIINNPESIYVSRHELLQQINGATTTAQNDEFTNSKFSSKFTGARTHDSWSSRASSILARAEDEPPYMSRTELLEKIALFGLGGIHQHNGRISSTSGETNDDDDDNDSNASTVKNVVLVKKTELQLERHFSNNATDDNKHKRRDNAIVEKQGKTTKQQQLIIRNDEKERNNRHNVVNKAEEEEHHPVVLSSMMEYSDACSCDSCNTYSDCSCCSGHSSYETGSNSSAETVVNGRISSDGGGDVDGSSGIQTYS